MPDTGTEGGESSETQPVRQDQDEQRNGEQRNDPNVPKPPVNVATAYPTNHGSTMTSRFLLLLPIGLIIALLYLYSWRDAILKRKLEVKTEGENDTVTNIAVCYTGHVGTYEQVFEQNDNAFTSVESSHVDYFFVMDLEDNYKDSRSGTHYNQNTHDKEKLQDIFDNKLTHSVISSEFYSSKSLTPPSECNDNAKSLSEPIQDDAGHFSSAYATLYANKRCYDLVNDYEKRIGSQFDWIIRMRPDMKISVRIPPDNVTERIHTSGFSMALVPRSLAHIYFSTVQAFDDESCEHMSDSGSTEVCDFYSYDHKSAECLLMKWLKRHDSMPSNGLYVNRRIVYPPSE